MDTMLEEAESAVPSDDSDASLGADEVSRLADRLADLDDRIRELDVASKSRCVCAAGLVCPQHVCELCVRASALVCYFSGVGSGVLNGSVCYPCCVMVC